jgi:hypothetical protein
MLKETKNPLDIIFFFWSLDPKSRVKITYGYLPDQKSPVSLL